MKNSSQQRTIDLDIHGVVTVRLVDPPSRTVAAFAERMGADIAPATSREADIIVDFQEEFTSAGMKYVGLNSVGFTDEGFYLLDKTNGDVEARITFESIGNRCEITCQRDAKTVPLLLDIIIFTFLKKGFVPLHASAFVYDGTGIVVMGWPKGGKTSAMLSFINHGAQYVGDEWVLLSSDGQKVFGLPFPVGISEWLFGYIPKLMPKVNIQQQLFFGSIHLLDSFQGILGRSRYKRSYPAKILKKAIPPLKRQLKVSRAPQVIFEDLSNPLETTPDKLFLILSHDDPSTTVEPCDPSELAERMVNANVYEQRDFHDYYRAYKFAFPNRMNDFLEHASELQISLLCQVFEGKETYKVSHPYGEPLEPLFERMRPFCQK